MLAPGVHRAALVWDAASALTLNHPRCYSVARNSPRTCRIGYVLEFQRQTGNVSAEICGNGGWRCLDYVAIGVPGSSFMGRRKLAGDLTSFFTEPPAQRRGRHTELSDPQLHNRRDQLVGIFEGAWGEIGWELHKCKKAGELIRIFHPLAQGYIETIISVFCRQSTGPASAATQRKVRAELYSIVEPLRTTDELRREAQE